MTQRRSSALASDNRAMRTLVLDQKIRYRYSEPVTNLHQRLRVVPPSAHGPQLRRRWHLSVEGVQSSSTRTFVDRFGNVIVDVFVPQISDAVDFVLDVEVCADRSGPCEIDFDERYLRPTRLTESDEIITEMASGVSGADLGSICAWVHRSLDYGWGVTGVRTTASEALAGGRGVCQDYAHIMLAVCRRAGLAARYVSGHLTGEGGSHAWVEVLQPHPHRNAGWVAEGWDPTHDRRTNADYLVVAVGRDYADVAPLSGTYDGNGARNSLAVDKRLGPM